MQQAMPNLSGCAGLRCPETRALKPNRALCCCEPCDSGVTVNPKPVQGTFCFFAGGHFSPETDQSKHFAPETSSGLSELRERKP